MINVLNPRAHNGVGVGASSTICIGPFAEGDRLESLVFMVDNVGGALSVDVVLKDSGEASLNLDLDNFGVTQRSGGAGVQVTPPGDLGGNHTGSVEVPVCLRFHGTRRFVAVRPNFTCGLFWKWSEGK